MGLYHCTDICAIREFSTCATQGANPSRSSHLTGLRSRRLAGVIDIPSVYNQGRSIVSYASSSAEGCLYKYWLICWASCSRLASFPHSRRKDAVSGPNLAPPGCMTPRHLTRSNPGRPADVTGRHLRDSRGRKVSDGAQVAMCTLGCNRLRPGRKWSIYHAPASLWGGLAPVGCRPCNRGAFRWTPALPLNRRGGK